MTDRTTFVRVRDRFRRGNRASSAYGPRFPGAPWFRFGYLAALEDVERDGIPKDRERAAKDRLREWVESGQ
jgi:hypothetical protein